MKTKKEKEWWLNFVKNAIEEGKKNGSYKIIKKEVDLCFKTKPCFFCGEPAPVIWDHKAIFNNWSSKNNIICDWRVRFDGVRERLKWASVDESDKGAHPECALKWAITEEGFNERYPII